MSEQLKESDPFYYNLNPDNLVATANNKMETDIPQTRQEFLNEAVATVSKITEIKSDIWLMNPL